MGTDMFTGSFSVTGSDDIHYGIDVLNTFCGSCWLAIALSLHSARLGLPGQTAGGNPNAAHSACTTFLWGSGQN